jgi:hypothetical protein
MESDMTTRILRTKAQWRSLLEQQAISGLKGAAFCRQQKLCCKTFYRHRKAWAAKSTDLVASPFIQVQAKPNSAPTLPMTLLDYGQSRLQIPVGLGPAWVAELMKALS